MRRSPLFPLLALTAVLALTLTACDSGVAPDARPDLATGDDFAFGKEQKKAYCHNGWTSNEAGVLTQQYYLIEVNNSLVNGKGRGNDLSHDRHHPEQLDAWGNTVDPDDDYACLGVGYAMEDGVCTFEGEALPCEKDSDGDGVWDSADACPDTPEGLEVGSDGCEPTEPTTCATNTIGMAFTPIEAGTFRMGQNDIADAYPEHEVTITRDFCMGTYEVTQGQWRAVMGEPPVGFAYDACPGETEDNCPAENVSWNDVQAFITALNAKEGTTAYRLPTEAEWEYAARAGTATEWSWGSSAADADTYAWYYDNASAASKPVGMKQPNPWGLYDVHGNVQEWVQDWYGPYTADVASDPTGPDTGSYRVSRGGSLANPAFVLRSAYRNGETPDFIQDYVGFRLLRAGS